MSVYLDASVLVALFIQEPHSARAEEFVETCSAILVVSDFARAEFASAVGRRTRMRDITLEQTGLIFMAFDTWARRGTERMETGSSDIATAEQFFRRLDLNLRTPDALNIALAKRIESDLVTFDSRMAGHADALGARATLL